MSAKQQIIAAMVARGKVVLAEYVPEGNNFSTVSRRLISQIPTNLDSKKSYSYENYNFHYLVEQGLIYLCMTEQDLGYRVPYAFLFDLTGRFKSMYGAKAMTANENAMQDQFSRIIKDRLEFYSNPGSDKINQVKMGIEQAKQKMENNIEKVLDRSEKIEVLVDKTDDLQFNSSSFKVKGTKLKKNKMWWKNIRMWCLLICVCTILISVLVVGALWQTGILNFSELFGVSNTPTAKTGVTQRTTVISPTKQ